MLEVLALVLASSTSAYWSDAITAGGSSPAEVARLGAQLEARTRFIEDLRDIEPPEARARALLRRLHGSDLLQTYDPRATTLQEIIASGRFNCVSSAVLFSGLALELGLEVQAELQPTHARSQVRGDRGWSVVETTSPQGFDPEAQVRRAIAEEVVGAIPDGWTETEGEVADVRVLVAAIWINRGILAQRAGSALEAAEHFERGMGFADSDALRRGLLQQRALILMTVASDALAQGRLVEALDWMEAVYSVGNLDRETARVRDANLEAIAQRFVRARAFEAPREVDALLERIEGKAPHRVSARIRAFIRLEQGQRFANTSAWADAARSFGEAVRLLGQDPSSALAERELASARSAWAQAEARLGQLDHALSLLPADSPLRPSLFMAAGARALDASDLDAARRIYGRCRRSHPAHPPCEDNLVVTLQRSAIASSQEAQCDAAEAWVRSIEQLRPASDFGPALRNECWTRSARTSFEAGRFEEALGHMQKVLLNGVDRARAHQNARAILGSWVRAAPGDCSPIRREFDALRKISPTFRVDLGPCRP